MGSATSKLPFADLQSYRNLFISLIEYDSMVIGYAGQSEIDAIRSAITTYWSKGIQKEEAKYINPNKPVSKGYKFKLNGNPFMSGMKDSAIQSRQMAAGILMNLFNLGWRLVVSSDLSRFVDLTTWIFQKETPMYSSNIFSIGISSWDSLQINNCPDSLHSVIKDMCSCWPNGIQEETYPTTSTYQIKLKGNPWHYVNKEESCAARLMLKKIIQALSWHQWMLYGNSNLKSTADTLFFQYVPQLAPGEFIIVSLNRNDRLRFIDVPDGIISGLEDIVRQSWPKGIQEVIDTRPICYELKLKGHPWWASGQEAIESRLLIVKIMERLSSMGYFIKTGLDITRKENDKSALVFQRGSPLVAPFMCLSMNETDKIRLINAPSNVIEAGRKIMSGWVLGVQEEKITYNGVSHQAKLKGNPWSSIYHGDGAHGRALLLRLLEAFTDMGWRLVCSIDVSAKYIHQDKGPDYPIDVHSWYFMYDEAMFLQMQQLQHQQSTNFQPNLYPQLETAPPSYNEAVGYK